MASRISGSQRLHQRIQTMDRQDAERSTRSERGATMGNLGARQDPSSGSCSRPTLERATVSVDTFLPEAPPSRADVKITKRHSDHRCNTTASKCVVTALTL